ncbi:MAG TPA: 16S rRNA (uracil(1498)-N(3))-methyltransferase [Gammaproteobacteria bacterium]|nr:16S rRNA (uracil(1498)-N(3))-methyltransferase [Gammaproteobacteria bacterium]
MPSHNRRLYLDQDLSAERIVLSEREARYLGSVLRLKPGDRVRTFNGRGQERDAAIRLLARRQAELTMLDAFPPLPESKLRLTLIQALPKAEAMDLVVQKATELGVQAIAPVLTDFSVARPDAERAARRIEHWMRIAQSACEQCGRHRPTEIRPIAALEACLEGLPADAVKRVLDPSAVETLPPSSPASTEICLLIGPEGGFSPGDLDLIAANGFRPSRLGPRILRTETASIVACGVLQSLWGDLR